MPNKPQAVIILNWNGLELLKQFIPSAARYTIDENTDLIVADNGSTDRSVQWLRENHPEVKIIILDRNYGFAEGYNRAIAQTHYPFTLLLNSDVEVTPNWTKPLLQFMQENPDVGAVQPKILSFKNRDMFEYAGAAGGYLDRNGYPYCRGRLFSNIEQDHGQYDDAPADIAWASGAAFLVRTDLYEKVGGLDADFFAHMEEIDLCLRIQEHGFRVCVVPQSSVHHVGGASLAQGNPQKTYLNFRNNLLLLHKNMPLKEGKRKLLIRRLYDTLAWGMFMLKFDFANANAVLKAHRDFRTMRRKYTRHPATNFMCTLPGAKRNIIIDCYIKRMKI